MLRVSTGKPTLSVIHQSLLALRNASEERGADGLDVPKIGMEGMAWHGVICSHKQKTHFMAVR